MLPDLPDIDGVAAAAIACIGNIAPQDVDEQYVMDNYGAMAVAAASAGVCVSNALGGLQANLITYAGQIYTRLFDMEKSLLTADRNEQMVNGYIAVTVTPIDIYGNKLADDLPPGVVAIQVFTTLGTLSTVEEVLDDLGVSTGVFRTVLTSRDAGVAQVTATVGGRYVSDFDATLDVPDLVPRALSLTFISDRASRQPTDSTEPLGAAGSEE